MDFEYFYGHESEGYSFYRIPKFLFTDEEFAPLSAEAKTVYGILLDRMGMSTRNGWMDDHGRVFGYMKVVNLARAMGCARQKAGHLLAELDAFGLIEREKQHLGKPDRIYVKNFIRVRKEDALKTENRTSRCTKSIP